MSKRINFKLDLILGDKGNIVWVLLQHLLVKGLFAAKFLAAARLLGPEQFGLVGVAIATLAIVESLSDTGIGQALIQREKLVSSQEAGAVWTIQIVRGATLLCVLFYFSDPIAGLFGIANAAPLIAFAALLPLVRNAVNPGYAILQRERDFRSLACSESGMALIDSIATIYFIYFGFGPLSVLIGALVADSCRFAVSWGIFRLKLEVNFKWYLIRDLGRYGKWIWGTSVITVILNQFDKILVGRWLGASQFGMYQTASRLAQMAIADVAVALGGFLFPTITNLHHQDTLKAQKYFFTALKKIGLICGFIATVGAIVGPFILNFILGDAWRDIGRVFQIQCLSMWLGSLIAVCVAFLKAVGKPHVVSLAVLAQLIVLVLPAYWVIQRWGSFGMASLVATALGVSLLIMLAQARK